MSHRPVPYINTNAVCFFNALMQALLALKTFRKFIKDLPEFSNYTNDLFPTTLLRRLNICMGNQSASEYCMFLIDWFKMENIFDYVYKIRSNCHNCDHESFKEDKTCISMINSFDEFLESREMVEGVVCDGCKVRSTMHHHRYLHGVNDIIVISLNKYLNKTMINYPLEFALDDRKYTLISIVEHHGNLQNGHYFANIFSTPTSHFIADDSRIQEVQGSLPGSPNAYLLFYEISC